MKPPPNVLMVGTGEYTTGFVHAAASDSDKAAGVVALTLCDLRAAGQINRLLLAGTRGTKFPAIRDHMQAMIATPYGLDPTVETFPADAIERDPLAYHAALDTLEPGDAVTVFTPDDTHADIALAAIERGCHVLVAKPLVKTLADHWRLVRAAEAAGVVVAMEVHKRWDPMYADARDRIALLGDCGYFQSYMSQPRTQLETFRHWAGTGSDISYYLNAHHIDFHQWAMGARARPDVVTAAGSTGVATGMGIDTEDTIALTVQWANADASKAVGVYTASWTAPKSDVHSQQRFFYQGQRGEITIDQAHRGYHLARDATGLQSPNPLFMKYTPDAQGRFAGQHGYGYRSIADFVAVVRDIRGGSTTSVDVEHRLATALGTLRVTAILEAGRISLDAGGAPVRIESNADGHPVRLVFS